jgi:mannose-1-phosphate guanylyltransferase
MGIAPTYPSEKYGYIKPDGSGGYTFTEKPTKDKAEEYIKAGALWNGGVFAYRLSYVLDKAEALLGTADYAALFHNYASLKKISFDYAVVEQETDIEVLRYAGTWKDIGTWNTFTEAMEDAVIGRGMIGDGCEGVHIVNNLNLPILAMGLKDTVIAAGPDGILVSAMDTADGIKPYVDKLSQQIMFAEKSWGRYQVLDVQEGSMTILATLNPGQHMSYHSHENRDEVWTVIRGTGKTIVDGMEQQIRTGDVITMEAGSKHTVYAGEAGLQLIEVQIGKEISAADKHKYEL